MMVERSREEALVSGLVYMIALAGMVWVGVWLTGLVFTTSVFYFVIACATVAAVYWSRSRFVTIHALHAIILLLLVCLIGLIPLGVKVLQSQGMLVPVTRGIRVLDPNMGITWLGVIVFGMPLTAIGSQSLKGALGGEFFAWPLLNWLRRRLEVKEEE